MFFLVHALVLVVCVLTLFHVFAVLVRVYRITTVLEIYLMLRKTPVTLT